MLAGTEAVLGVAIANKILASDAPEDIRTQIRASWTEIAKVILDHIVANAVISTTVTGTATVSSFGTPGPVVGTGTGTVG